MGPKIILFVTILLANLNGFSQAESIENDANKIKMELSVGKIFSPYRFYKNHTGYESILLGISKDLSSKYGVLFSQLYGRIYSENTNNRTLVMTTTLNPYLNFFTEKKLNYRLSAGTGLLFLNSKCLYPEYPITENIYGIPVKINFAVFYNLNNKLALNFNVDTHYSFLFSGDYNLIINDSYYYKTFFFSVNIGVRYGL